MNNRHLLLALVLLAASCARTEQTEPAAPSQIIITASFSNEQPKENEQPNKSELNASELNKSKTPTKATATAFEVGDELGLFVVRSGQEIQSTNNLVNNAKLITNNDGSIKGQDDPIYYPTKTATSLYSYYPYQSGHASADALDVHVGIRTDQTDLSQLKLSDLCFGSKLNITASNSAQAITFTHRFAQLTLNITAFDEIKAVRLLNIKDSAKLNIQTGAVTLKDHTAEIVPFKTNPTTTTSTTTSTSTTPTTTTPTSTTYTAIIPAQTLTGACIAIDLKDGKTYTYNAVNPIALTQSATNTLNLTIHEKGDITLNGTAQITPWGVNSSKASISQSTDNSFVFYFAPPITEYTKVNRAYLTLTNPTTKVTKRYEVTDFTVDPLSVATNAIFRFSLTKSGEESLGYPVTIDKFELFNGTSVVHTLSDYYGGTITKAGDHTFGTVTSIKLDPATDWVKVSNTKQDRIITITTTGNTTWSATTTDAGLTVTPTSGVSGSKATISWAAQITDGDSPARSGSVTFTSVPSGVSYVVHTNQLMGPYYMSVSPSTAWSNVVNTGGTQNYTIATGNLAGWTATTTSTPTAGLTISPSTGTRSTTPTLSWAAQAVGALARTGSVTFNPNPTSTATPITVTTNQLAGPAPTLTATSLPSIVGAGKQTYSINVISNTAWSASNLTNLSLDKTSGNAGTTAVQITIPLSAIAATRSVSVKFSTNAVPSGAVAAQTVTTTQAAKPANAIAIGDIYWATGNLIANGANGCKIGAPGDGGLYFQYGGLIGYKGGTNGDGTGIIDAAKHPNGVFWNGATSYSANDISVTPTGYTSNKTMWPYFDNVNAGGFGYYYYNSFVTKYADFQTQANGTNVSIGIGDPCAHYLGSAWRLPTCVELSAITGNASEGWVPWSTAGVTGRWEKAGPQSSIGAWFGPNSRTDTPTIAADLFIPASGFRYYSNGVFSNVGVYGCAWSSSIVDYRLGFSLNIRESGGVLPRVCDTRSYGLPVRCVSAS